MDTQTLVTPQVKEMFLRHGIPRRFAPGEVLFEKGRPADRVGFIAAGQARTYCLNPAGDEIVLFYIDKDNLICSEALMDHPSVIVSVSAITPLELYTLPPNEFLRLWQAQGLPLQELFAHFVRRITLLSDYICCTHFLEDDKRVAYFLHSCYTSTGPVISYTHEQIAAITGMSRVSVTRILKRFREASILSQEYRRIRILDAQRLSEVFHSLGYFLD